MFLKGKQREKKRGEREVKMWAKGLWENGKITEEGCGKLLKMVWECGLRQYTFCSVGTCAFLNKDSAWELGSPLKTCPSTGGN